MRVGSETRVHAVTCFVSGLPVFGIYFGAVGFGSQAGVQDVIAGLTMVFSDRVDVGDRVEIGGQAGIFESVDMRFAALVRFSGARISVPNPPFANVIHYPSGYLRAYVDARLPADPVAPDEAERRLTDLPQATYEQCPAILLLPPTVQNRHETPAASSHLASSSASGPARGRCSRPP